MAVAWMERSAIQVSKEYPGLRWRSIRATLASIDESNATMKRKLAPVHPGEVLKEEFMQPLGLSANALARAIHVPPNRVAAIVNGTRSVTADTALRLSRAFNTTPDFWLNLQKRYDLDIAADHAADLGDIRPIERASVG